MNLDKAYKNSLEINLLDFLNSKAKRIITNSYTTNNQKGTVSIENGYIKVPKLKSMIKIKQHRNFIGLIKSCTISQVPSGKYFISILVDTENIQLPKRDNKIGVDLGIKEFAITSDGKFFHNPKHLKKSEKKIS